MKEIKKKQWNYLLREDDKKQIILSVLSGSVGLFYRNIILTQDEVINFSELGDSFIDMLVEDIRNCPDKYNDRYIVI